MEITPDLQTHILHNHTRNHVSAITLEFNLFACGYYLLAGKLFYARTIKQKVISCKVRPLKLIPDDDATFSQPVLQLEPKFTWPRSLIHSF